jgi:hypothetical protein
LKTEVSALSPRVAFLDHQRLILNVDNSALKQRIAALAQDKIFKDGNNYLLHWDIYYIHFFFLSGFLIILMDNLISAHQEALKKEIERLRQIYHQQNLKKMSSSNQNASSQQAQQHNINPTSSDHPLRCTDKEQLLN